MEAKELRIGNWVNNPVQKIDFQLDIPTFNKMWADEKMNTKTDERFKPIPLTEEWLLKFGYKKLDKYTYTHKGWFIHFRVKRGGFVYNKRTKIEYVHQLQNLYFALTNEELIIK